MIAWVEFKSANGGQHPNADFLKKTPLSLLIVECLHKHKDVFGNLNSINVYLSDDGTLGELHLSPNALERWVEVTVVQVNISMFEESPLSENLHQSVVQFFNDFAEKNRK